MPDLRTVTDHLSSWAQRQRDATAITWGDVAMSFGQLDAAVADTALRMAASGVAPGERVVLAGVNTPAWVVGFLATLRVGGVVVPMNSRLSRTQVRDVIAESAPRLVLIDRSQEAAFVDVPRHRHRIVSLDDGAIDSLGAIGPLFSGVLPPAAIDSPALISFTSGTMSTPKAALLSHRSIVAGVRGLLPHALTGPGSRTTTLVPLFHNTGYIDQLCHMMIVGGSVDLVERYRTAAASDAMARRPPSFLAVVPSILRMLMLDARADEILGECTAIVFGGSAMPSEWIHELGQRWPQLRAMHAYGLTEFTSLSHLVPASASSTHDDSVGLPVAGVRCSIRDDAGAELRAGDIGEVWLAGPQRMMRYWNNEDATRKAISGEWLRTGDLGSVDNRGYLRLLGRRDGVINRGGEKIHPVVVEDLMARVPSIAEAVVVGVPDPLLGQRVCAAVVMRPGSSFDHASISRALASQVPDYAVPEDFEVLDELPLAATGKVDRSLINQLFGSTTRGDRDRGR